MVLNDDAVGGDRRPQANDGRSISVACANLPISIYRDRKPGLWRDPHVKAMPELYDNGIGF